MESKRGKNSKEHDKQPKKNRRNIDDRNVARVARTDRTADARFFSPVRNQLKNKKSDQKAGLFKVGRGGIEPLTPGFSGLCETD